MMITERRRADAYGSVDLDGRRIWLLADWTWDADEPRLEEAAQTLVPLFDIPESVGNPAAWALRTLNDQLDGRGVNYNMKPGAFDLPHGKGGQSQESLAPHPLHRIIGELRPCDLPARYAEEPFKSEAQRRWMWANDPEMARRWEDETPDGKDLPERVSGESWLDTWKRGPLASEAWSQHEGPRGGTYYLRDGDQESKTYRRPGELEPRPAGLLAKADTTAKQDRLADAIAAVAAGQVSDRARDLYDEPDYQQAHDMRDLRNAYPALRRAQDAITGLVLLDRPAELEAWAAGKSHPQTALGLNTLAALAPRFYPEPLTLYRAKSHWKGEALGLWTDSIDEADRLGGVLETREVRPDEIVAGPKMSADLSWGRMFLVRGDGQDHTSHFPLTEPLQKFADGLGKPAYVSADRYVNHPAEPVLDAIHDRLGREWPDEDYARLGGALEGAKVFLTGDQDTLEISIESPEYFCGRAVGVVDGQLVMENQQFEVYRDHQGRGLGTKVFAQQIAACERMGVTKIGCEAARSGEMNGYYTWPRLGYDAELTADEWAGRASKKKYQSLTGESDEAIRRAVLDGITKLGLPLDRSFRLQDLMQSPDGRALWKRYGVTIQCLFDPRPGSVSRRVFDAYVKEKFPDLMAAESWARLWGADGDEPLELEIPDRRVNEFDVGPDDDEEVFARIWDRIAAEEAGGRRRISEAAPLGRVRVVENAFDPHYILARELGLIRDRWDLAAETWDESKVKRDAAGRFDEKGGGESSPVRVLAQKLGEPQDIDADETANGTLEAINGSLQRDWTVRDLATACGAMKGTTVEVRDVTLSENSPRLQFRIAATQYRAECYLSARDGEPKLIVGEVEVNKAHQRQGIGTKFQAQMVAACERLGIKTIMLEAARAPWMNGYYTWPLFGYDAELTLDQFVKRAMSYGSTIREKPDKIKAKILATAYELGLPRDKAFRLSDLMRSEEGQELWKRYGSSIACQFDTQPGSLSRRVFDAYVSRRFPDGVAAESWADVPPNDEPIPGDQPSGPGCEPGLTDDDEALLRRIWRELDDDQQAERRSIQESRAVEDWTQHRGPRGGTYWLQDGDPASKTYRRPGKQDAPPDRAAQPTSQPAPSRQGTTEAAGRDLRGTVTIRSAVAHWTPEQRKADWKANNVEGVSFKAWFGDWQHDRENASKVVDSETGRPKETGEIPGTGSVVTDDDGKPMVVYHGTKQGGFSAFDKSKLDPAALYGPGFYFTEDKYIADSYREKGVEKRATFARDGQPYEISRDDFERIAARDDLPEKVRMQLDLAAQHSQPEYRLSILIDDYTDRRSDPETRQLGMDLASLAGVEVVRSGRPETKAVYLNIRHPYDADTTLLRASEIKIPSHWKDYERMAAEEVLAEWGERRIGVMELKKRLGENRLPSLLQASGFDGITHIGGNRAGQGKILHRVWIAFEPEQIKSVDNAGTFDDSKANIYEAWTPYRGKRGGEGWQWDGQGKPRYQKEMPRERGPAVSVDLPDTQAGVSSAASVASDPQRALFDKSGESAPARTPAKSRAELESRYARVADLYRQDAGVSEGYTIGEHTGMVLDMWDRHTNPDELAALSKRLGVDVPRVMQTALMLHDIGKPLAIEEGEKWRQHEFTLPIMADVMAQEGFGPREIQLAQAVVGHDLFGDVLRGRLEPSAGATRLISQAQLAGVDPVAFSELASLYFTADAASYPYLYNKVFREGEGGRLEFKSPAYRELMDEVVAQSPKPELPRGSEAIQQHVATWTPEERERDWKERGTRGGSFKAFFGDWEHDLENCSKVLDQETGEPKETAEISGEGSKVTDEDGLPKIVYHGTVRGGFAAFDPTKMKDPDGLLYGPGFYFTEDPEIASEYAGKKVWNISDSLETREEAERLLAEKAQEWTERYGGKMEEFKLGVREDGVGWRVFGEGYEQWSEKVLDREANAADIGRLRDIWHGEMERAEQAGNEDEVTRARIRYLAAAKALQTIEEGGAWQNSERVQWVWQHLLGTLPGDERLREQLGVKLVERPVKSETKAVYLNIRNPLDVDKVYPPELVERFCDAMELRPSLRDALKWKPEGRTGDELVQTMYNGGYGKQRVQEALMALGFDGITHIGGRIVGHKDHRVWIAFEPTQIKAKDNRGTFDASSANMYESWLSRYGTRVAMEEWARHEGPRGGVYWLKDGLGKPRYQKEQPGEAESGQKRARPGGEIGPNREFYRGGTFIATTELPLGDA